MKNLLFMFLAFGVGCSEKTSEFVMEDYEMCRSINPGATVSYSNSKRFYLNDIVVFLSSQTNQKTCLRLVGFPGDTVEIREGKLYINEIRYDFRRTAVFTKELKLQDSLSIDQFTDFDVRPFIGNTALINLSIEEEEELLNSGKTDSLYSHGLIQTYVDTSVIKVKNSRYANKYFFGPIVIPKKEELVTNDNLILFRFSDSAEEVGKKVSDSYYFCISDNFSDGTDSRVLGLIPASRILGIVDKVRNVRMLF